MVSESELAYRVAATRVWRSRTSKFSFSFRLDIIPKIQQPTAPTTGRRNRRRTIITRDTNAFLNPKTKPKAMVVPMRSCRSVANAFRSYATNTKPSRLGTTLSLEHFLQRARVLAFYRTILRGTSHIRDSMTKSETRQFARAEFERHRNVKDAAHVRYLMSTGKTEWESMERYIGGL
ncbi:hypothetical protein GGR57DRAFT_392083 [Xylariaceae sp. FL1272]|nr:hypothetical protein GGR57DRAFT_392083 [Xylariaceae sp. FL1272]